MEKKIRSIHIVRLAARIVLFLAAMVYYIIKGHTMDEDIRFMDIPVYAIIWVFFVIDMIFRFIPSRYESMGCQKLFKRNFIPDQTVTQVPESVKRNNVKAVITVGSIWIIVNGAIGAAYLIGLINKEIVLLISLFYSICDIVCILFYCPFQSLFMKNRCCVMCRIYNWDFPMMFTPLVFIMSPYTLSLFFISIALLLRWEITYHLHKERFSDVTNQSLRCINCQDHLCMHKKAIRSLAKKTKQAIYEKARW